MPECQRQVPFLSEMVWRVLKVCPWGVRGVNGVATCWQSSASWYRFFKDIIRDGVKAVLVVALLSASLKRGGELREAGQEPRLDYTFTLSR